MMLGFYHIPRTGGTSYLFEHGSVGVSSHDFDEVDAANPDHTFTILREPRSRIISEYIYRWQGGPPWREPMPPKPSGTLINFIPELPQVYAEAVRRADEVLITEHLSTNGNVSHNWPPFYVGGSVSDLVDALTEATTGDMAVYLAAGGTDPDETLERVLNRYGITKERVGV